MQRFQAPTISNVLLSDPDIRYCVLASLDERFDAHLAQAENLQALFVALNDQVFEIRELAICTVGRLSSMNPAFVMPFLRKMLIQVMEMVEAHEMLRHPISSLPSSKITPHSFREAD